MTINITD